ncbi:hypothetical protein HID58_071075 [Brassica napus]|uniref:Uncharacterized protein n=4 Tax=Brassica TaxID=3705 RepID=A0ABQ7Z0M2_BRANA|nr:hypothetical protein HID58_071075 [Brassica napus]
MSGQTQDAAGIMTTLEEQQQTTGNIPLRLRVDQPVRIKFGKLKLMEVRFLVRCGVFVDSLAANNFACATSSFAGVPEPLPVASVEAEWSHFRVRLRCFLFKISKYQYNPVRSGSLPKFYQGHENTTVIDVEMSGQTQDAAGIMTTLEEQQQTTGNIPLRLRVDQPVRIKFGKLKLMEVRFLVRCGVFVDSLAANNVIKIQSSSCKFRLRL